MKNIAVVCNDPWMGDIFTKCNESGTINEEYQFIVTYVGPGLKDPSITEIKSYDALILKHDEAAVARFYVKNKTMLEQNGIKYAYADSVMSHGAVSIKIPVLHFSPAKSFDEIKEFLDNWLKDTNADV